MRVHLLNLPSVILMLAGLVLRVEFASADLLALQVESTSAPAGALDKAQADAETFLAKMTSLEGSGYTATEAGMAVPNSIRMLRDGSGEERQGERKLIDCPSQCSNSGSYTCRLLGCAYCGACRRLLTEDDRELWTNKQRTIEASLTSDLSAAYCQGKVGCSIKATIKRVNTDGTMTLAV
jgi:hypothetical protein